MNVAMDSDCLIKLTKAGLKERVCRAWRITVPASVRRETVDQAPTLADALRIRQNIATGLLRVAGRLPEEGKGEEAVQRLYERGGFHAVGTDDERFIRHLRGLGIPFAVPAVIVVRLCREGALNVDEAREALEALRPHISSEEYATGSLMIQGG
jgi:rRNA-processing protein FCF1